MAEDPRYDKITILMFVFVLLAPLARADFTIYPCPTNAIGGIICNPEKKTGGFLFEYYKSPTNFYYYWTNNSKTVTITPATPTNWVSWGIVYGTNGCGQGTQTVTAPSTNLQFFLQQGFQGAPLSYTNYPLKLSGFNP